MKKVFYFTIALFVVLFFSIAPVFAPQKQPSLSAITPAIKFEGFENNASISADKAILIERETGLVLYSKNPDITAGMASTTKIMTGIVILENMALDEVITITSDSVGVEGSSIYLTEGEQFTVESLLMGLLLESGNDAAAALAIGCCGSIEEFAVLMNKTAANIGMTNSNFVNPHGLSNEMHYTTARDLGILASYAMKNDEFRKIVSTKKATITPINSDKIRYLTNHNKLLQSFDGTTGIKTGYTKADGRCLVSSAQKGETELICVTLNGRDHWEDHKNLLSKGFEAFEKRILARKGEYASEISVVGGKDTYITAKNISDIELLIPKNSDIDIRLVSSPFVYAPISKGDILGEIRIYSNDKLIYSFPLCATNDVKVKKVSFFKRIFG